MKLWRRVGRFCSIRTPMIYLQTTQKARTTLGIGRETLGPPGATPSVLGNWLLNVVPMRERTALLFMSSQTR